MSRLEQRIKAVLIILAMSFGLIVPKLVIDYLSEKAAAMKA